VSYVRTALGLSLAPARVISPPITKALLEAARRGVRVNVVLGKSQESDRSKRDNSATYRLNNGVVPLIDDKHAIAQQADCHRWAGRADQLELVRSMKRRT
jgi:hypothetical protein